MSQSPDISVVVPVHNGEKTIADLCTQILAELAGKTVEIVLVDDGSRDGTWKTIEQLKQAHGTSVAGIRLSKNFGQHNATICGIGFAKGDLVITMDDDLRHSPVNIKDLLQVQQERNAEVVYGLNKSYAGGYTRKGASSMLKFSSKYFSQHKFGEGSSFRLMTRSLVDRLKENRGHIVYIDEILHWYTSRIEVAELDNRDWKPGRSRYSVFRLLRLYTDVVHNYAVWPLKWMIRIGAISSFFTFLLGAFFIYRKLFRNVEVEGFTATIVTILFSSGLILLSLGIIGLYIFKLYQIQSGRPSFSVSKII